jgi:hypothetical protein
MLLNVEIAHSNHALTARAEVPRYISLRDTVTLEIAEVAGADAPIAVSWVNAKGETGHTRWYGGRHFSPYSGPLDNDAALDALIGLATAPAELEGLTDGYFNAPAGNTFTVGDKRLVEFDQEARNAALACAKDFGEDCIIVDGAIYLACGTPRFVLGYLSVEVSTEVVPGHRRVGGHRRPHDAKNPQWFYSNRYGLEDEAGASGALAALYDIHGIRQYVFPTVEVAIPESIHTDDDYPRLREAAVFLIDNLSFRNRFSKMHPAFLRAVADVSEAAWEENGAPADPERLAHALDAAGRIIATQDPDGCVYPPQIIWRVEEASRRYFEGEIIVEPVLRAGPQP